MNDIGYCSVSLYGISIIMESYNDKTLGRKLILMRLFRIHSTQFNLILGFVLCLFSASAYSQSKSDLCVNQCLDKQTEEIRICEKKEERKEDENRRKCYINNPTGKNCAKKSPRVYIQELDPYGCNSSTSTKHYMCLDKCDKNWTVFRSLENLISLCSARYCWNVSINATPNQAAFCSSIMAW